MSVGSGQGFGPATAPPRMPSISPKAPAQVIDASIAEDTLPSCDIIDPHRDARAIVRLIQCLRCSLPIQQPCTLPCGNSLCRRCLPEQLSSPSSSTLEWARSLEAFTCPFEKCQRQHYLRDCSQDVTLSRITERVSAEVARQRSLVGDTPTLLDERLHWKNMIDSSKDERIPHARILNGGRLLATYSLAEIGELRYDSDVSYHTQSRTGDDYADLDISMLAHLKEATKSELDCQICYSLIHDPLTTSCGHTFCRHCVARILDYSPLCPVCRRLLRMLPGVKGIPTNQRVQSLLSTLCPELVMERAEQIAKENPSTGDKGVPLFVCTNAFPAMPTFLHIFEPRYRLMVRRAVENGENRFGMLMYNRHMQPQGDLGATQFMLYGTMLHINNVEMTRDGRSMLDTRGMFRFRVSRWEMLDGYIIAKIERIDDMSAAEESELEARETAAEGPLAPNDLDARLSRMSTLELLEICLHFVRTMRAASADWLRGAHYESHGEMPDDPALFPYWFASILPISDDEKYKLLPTASARERLKITASWVKRIEAQRW